MVAEVFRPRGAMETGRCPHGPARAQVMGMVHKAVDAAP
jgi:hypothetical protein